MCIEKQIIAMYMMFFLSNSGLSMLMYDEQFNICTFLKFFFDLFANDKVDSNENMFCKIRKIYI